LALAQAPDAVPPEAVPANQGPATPPGVQPGRSDEKYVTGRGGNTVEATYGIVFLICPIWDVSAAVSVFIRTASADIAVGLMKQHFMVQCTPRIKPQCPLGTVFLPHEIEDE
jgi:hypothetical protein